MTVISGRCVPPLNGLFSATTSPGFSENRRCSSTVRTLSPIAPRCTGTCGALATRLPSASKMAQEKSSRSLMLTLMEVFCSTAPVCSATFMNRLLNSSSNTGSGLSLPAATRVGRGFGAAQDHVVERGDLRGPARLDDGGGIGLAHQRRTGDPVAGQQRGALENRRLHLRATGKYSHLVDRFRPRRSRAAAAWLLRSRCPAASLRRRQLPQRPAGRAWRSRTGRDAPR